MRKDQLLLLSDWHRRCRKAQFMNNQTARMYMKRYYILGVIMILLSSTVSTSIFVSLQTEDTLNIYVRILICLISILSTIFSTLHTFLNYSERAEHHRTQASRYSVLRKRLETLSSLESFSDNDIDNNILEIQKELDELVCNTRTIPLKIYSSSKEQLDNEVRKNPVFEDLDRRRLGL